MNNTDKKLLKTCLGRCVLCESKNTCKTKVKLSRMSKSKYIKIYERL